MSTPGIKIVRSDEGPNEYILEIEANDGINEGLAPTFESDVGQSNQELCDEKEPFSPKIAAIIDPYIGKNLGS